MANMTSLSSDHPPDLNSYKKRLTPVAFLKRLALVIIIAIALYSLAGFFILPAAFTKLAPFILKGKEAKYSITIGTTSFNPYTFILNINNIAIYPNTTKDIDADYPLLAIDLLRLNLDHDSFSEKALIAKDLTVSGLFMHLIYQPHSNLNRTELPLYFSQSGEQFLYFLQNITIRDSEIIFENTATGTYQQAENIYLTMPVLTNLQDHIPPRNQKQLLQPSFSATLNGKEVSFNGKTLQDPDKLESNRFELDFHDVNIPTLLDFLPAFDQITVDKGLLDIKLEIVFPTTFTNGKSIEINSEGQIVDLKAKDSQDRSATIQNGSFMITGNPFTNHYKLNNLVITGLELSSPGNWQVTAPAIQTTNAFYKSGQLNLGKINGADVRINLATRLFTNRGQSKSWIGDTTLQSLDLIESEILISSNADGKNPELRLSKAEIHNSGLTSNPKSTGETMISGMVAGKGHVNLEGIISVHPLTANLDYQVKELPFTSLKPLLSSFIQPTMVADHISGAGQISYPTLKISGSASVVGIKTIISPERNLFSCPTTTLQNFKLTLAPQSLNIEEISFTKPLFTAVRTDRKQPALTGYLFPSPGKEPMADQPIITANTVRLTDGDIRLTDRTAMPVAMLRISTLNTVLTKMINQPGKQAPFSLQGTMQLIPHPADYPIANPGPPAQIAMKGEVTLFGDNPELKSSLEIHNFDLPSLGPYLAPLIGYQPDRGRLDLAADIDLHNHQLTSRNRFTIKELNLGSSTSGRFNTPLTVALLTNANGSIKLDLEVNGNLKKTSFSYTNALSKNIRRILTQTTSSPLSLATAENSRAKLREYFTFPSGKAKLESKQSDQLDMLTTVMKTRPLLKISLAGRVDPEKDFQKQNQPSQGRDKIKILKELAKSRADTIRESLIKNGIAGNRLKLEGPNDILEEEILSDRPMARADITPMI